jgi:hypothetical protein
MIWMNKKMVMKALLHSLFLSSIMMVTRSEIYDPGIVLNIIYQYYNHDK